MAGHVDAVAQRVRAEEGGVRVVAEDVDQRARVDRVDVLRVERQPLARQAVGDPAVHRAQPSDGGEEAQRAAAAGDDQPRIRVGERAHVPALHVGDDQHLRPCGIVERARRLEPRRRAGEMRRAGPRLRHLPAAAAGQRRGGDEHAVRGLQHRLGEGPRRVEPAAVEADVVLAALDALDRHPVDEVGVGGPADPREERQPRGHRLGAPADRGDRPLDARARRRVEPVGRLR